MISALLEYASKHNLDSPPGFTTKSARWAIQLSAQGTYTGVIELGAVEEKKNPGLIFSKAPDLTQPEMVAGGETKSHFLLDTVETVALYDPKEDDYVKKDEKTQAKHRFFFKLLNDTGIPELQQAAQTLVEAETMADLRQELAEKKVKPTEKITLQIDGSFPVEDSVWHEWWQQFRATLTSPKTAAADMMVCVITGKSVEPARSHPKITGLADVGAMSSGASLVGFDKDSFQSYGLDKSANAAMSNEVATTYRNALNHLLTHHSVPLLKAKVSYWFSHKVAPHEDVIASLFSPSEDEEIAKKKEEIDYLSAQQRLAEFLQSVHEGKRTDLADNEYYALILSGAAGRVMVRDWIQGKFETLAGNVKSWFDDLEIVHRNGGRRAPWPKFLAVLGATARELNAVPAPMAANLWQVALRGEPVPASVLAQVVARVKVDLINDSSFNHARMGLIKAYHLRQARRKGGQPMSEEQLLKPELNELHPEPAYHCGRLMAVLAALQRAALGDVGAGIVQRYYASASTTPALVLGRLERLSKFHLAKLDSPGLAYWYEDKLAQIWSRMKDSVPRNLSLEQQSLFAMGYYQQLVDLRTKKEKPAEEAVNNNTEEVN